MVSIPHYEDLSAKEIYDSLDLMWWASEKLDGHSLVFGLDDQGFYYSQGKGRKPCYTVEDWPNECWASTFRVVHTFGSMIVEELVKHNLILAGQNISAEVIDGNQPNTVPYNIEDRINVLMVTSTSFDASEGFFKLVDNFLGSWEQDHRMVLTAGITNVRHMYRARINPQIPRELTYARLAPSANQFKRVLEHWFHKDSIIEGFTVLDVLDGNFASKHPNCGSRNWNDLRKELAAERTQLKSILRDLTLLFKDTAYRVLVLEQPSCIGAGSLKEGVVVRTPTSLFKIVDQNVFRKANAFTHRVKYAIVGGRRPARPSFLSRTKDWPVEQRLARLAYLRHRYVTNHYAVHLTIEVGGKKHIMDYSAQLHRRTIGMFTDTEQRIRDGR